MIRDLTERDECPILSNVHLNRHTLELVRTRSGLSKAELADRAGVDRTLITRLENGERTATPAVIVKLAAALNCSQLALCDATPEPAVAAS